jgi:hypothetical protein
MKVADKSAGNVQQAKRDSGNGFLGFRCTIHNSNFQQEFLSTKLNKQHINAFLLPCTSILYHPFSLIYANKREPNKEHIHMPNFKTS